jgi:hypothetical protein
VITFRGEGYHLGVQSSDETSEGDLLEFYGLHRVGVGILRLAPCWIGVVEDVLWYYTQPARSARRKMCNPLSCTKHN